MTWRIIIATMSLEDLLLSLGLPLPFDAKEYRRRESNRYCSHEIDVYVTEHERNRSTSPLTTKKMTLSSYFETVDTIVEINDRSQRWRDELISG